MTDHAMHRPLMASRNTIGDAFRRSAARYRDKLALVYADRQWSYRELDAAANRVAAWLLQQELKPGDRVAALGKNSDLYLVLWLACTRSGLVHVPLNFALRGEELAYPLRHAGARALFVDQDLEPAVEEALAARGEVIPIRQRLRGEHSALLQVMQAGDDPGEPEGPPSAAAPVQIMYTSGTTSLPKGVVLSHEGQLSHYLSCIIECEYHASDRVLAALPLYHTAQLHVFCMPQLLVGASVWLIDSAAPERCLAMIEEHQLNSFFAPPTVWINLLRSPERPSRNIRSLRKLYYGASIMPGAVVRELQETLQEPRLYNCYGQTEMGSLATVLSPEDHAERPTSAGKPVLHVETRIVNEELAFLGPGETGEIVHRSPQVMQAYLDNQEATREAFDGGWFHSGDLGYFDEEGYLYIVDRVKDVVNSGGVLVSSREVEEVIYKHPAVSEVAVIALPDPRWIEAVCAVVVLREGQQASAEQLIDWAGQSLARYKVPKRVFFTDHLPVNPSGKVLKRELRDQFAEQVKAG